MGHIHSCTHMIMHDAQCVRSCSESPLCSRGNHMSAGHALRAPISSGACCCCNDDAPVVSWRDAHSQGEVSVVGFVSLAAAAHCYDATLVSYFHSSCIRLRLWGTKHWYRPPPTVDGLVHFMSHALQRLLVQAHGGPGTLYNSQAACACMNRPPAAHSVSRNIDK